MDKQSISSISGYNWEYISLFVNAKYHVSFKVIRKWVGIVRMLMVGVNGTGINQSYPSTSGDAATATAPCRNFNTFGLKRSYHQFTTKVLTWASMGKSSFFLSVQGKLKYLGNILLYVIFLGIKESRVTLRHLDFSIDIINKKILNMSY